MNIHDKACIKCMFFDMTDKIEGRGYCKKNPPQLTPDGGGDWARVKYNDWCFSHVEDLSWQSRLNK